MDEKMTLRTEERQAVLDTVKRLQALVDEVLNPDDFHKIKDIIYLG